MHIEVPHPLSKEEAIRRIDASIAELLQREPPAGVSISDVAKTWVGEVMNFSFRARKGFFGVTIGGRLQVGEGMVALDAELPGILKSFISEEKIRADIQRQLGQILAG
jgi:hypothetical protein